MLDVSKTYKSNNCGLFNVIKYTNAKNVEIKFIDTGATTIASAGEIKRGSVKDRMRPAVYGVGFIGDGSHRSRVNGKSSDMYNVWVSMLQRCYSEKCQKINPTYVGVTVCDEWHNFQNFAEWYSLNYVIDCHIDKDIKTKGNKVYSPEGCMFVSQKENTAFAFAKHYRFISPQGDIVDIYNMREFCRKNDVTSTRMSAVHRGDELQHKGWRKA